MSKHCSIETPRSKPASFHNVRQVVGSLHPATHGMQNQIGNCMGHFATNKYCTSKRRLAVVNHVLFFDLLSLALDALSFASFRYP